MRDATKIALLVLILALIASSGSVGNQTGADNRPPYVPDEILIKLKPGASADARSAVLALVSAESLRTFRSGAEHWLLSGIGTERALERLASHPAVEYAEPNFIVQAGLTPNDTRYIDLWGMHNTGQTGGTPGADIDAELAWDITTGSTDVVVGVIDSGVDYNHPDLVGNIWTNTAEIADNGIDDDGNGYVDDVRGWDFVNNDNDPMDDHSHGTHVSGTIAGRGNNALGVVGVSWRASIIPLKFLNAGGSGSTANAILAVEYATMMGADITNNSWGGGGFSQALLDAINAGGAANILFVASAGNSGVNTDVSPQYPAGYDSDFIVSVAATDHNDLLASFSNYGAETVDLGAPGVSTLSSVPGGGYGYKSGTSMAAPHVAGTAALIRALRPGLDLLIVKSRLMDEGDPIPALDGITVSGNRLNAFLAIREPDAIPPGAITDLAVSATGITNATLVWTASGDDGSTGRATSYHVRYAEEPLTEANFETGTLVSGVPAPQVAGSPEQVVVDGLLARTTYHFAVLAVDEWGNRSPVSNGASGTTEPGIPEIAVGDEEISVESTLTYGTSGLTSHVLPLPETPDTGGTLRLVADGDFGDSSESATMTAEGIEIGSVGSVGVDCTPAQGEFALSAFDLATLAADGFVTVDVQNSQFVDLFCSVNEHRVRLDYRPSAVDHDYGQVFVGGSAPWTVRISNGGTDVLQVTSIATDAPEFGVSAATLSIGPGSFEDVVVTFAPGSATLFNGTLRIQSNDPDEGDLTFDLTGEGIDPPDIDVAPDRFDEALVSGESVTRLLTISNTGVHDLEFEIRTTGPEPDEGPGPAEAPGPGVPGGPGQNPEYADGAEPMREPMSPEDIGDVIGNGTEASVLILQSGTNVSEIQSLLESYSDITAVDVFDVLNAVPTLEYLEGYDAVLLVFNSQPSQRDAIGDLLADYADGGGRVVMTLASVVSGWEPRGRFLAEGYAPFNPGSGPIGSSTLGDYVAGHPIMEGVQSVVGQLLAAVTLAPGAEWVADWQFGQPMVATNALGVVGINVYLGGVGGWSGDVPLLVRNAVFYGSEDVSWLSVDTASGVVAPGASVNVSVTIDAADLFGGFYEARLIVESNDPDEPEVVVPVTLDVTGAPEISLLGGSVTLTSSIDYGVDGAITNHAFPISVAPGAGSDGSIDLIVDGDFGLPSEYATASAEGNFLGEAGRVGPDCAEGSASFPLSPSLLAGLAADGTVDVEVENTPQVNVFCAVNRHTVRLNYRGQASALSYGELFIGLTSVQSVEIRNDGTDLLDVTGIVSDEPDFVPSAASLQIPPQTSAILEITFAPSRAGAIPGVLTITSNDADEGVLTIDLSGTGLVPPDFDVTPTAISDHLFSGEQATHVLSIANTGGSDLVVGLEIASALDNEPAPPGAPRSDGQPAGGPLAPAQDPGASVVLADPAILESPDDDFRFADDFEDGNLDGWFIAHPSTGHEVTDQTAADGTVYSYRQFASPGGHQNGLYRDFGQQQPKYARFFVRASSTTRNVGYFVLRDPNGQDGIFFFAQADGTFYVNADVGGHDSFAYQADTWHEIEFRNIDFVLKTFDYYVDGTLILAGIPFRSSSIASLYRLDLYNYSSGSEAWWDEIVVTARTAPEWISLGSTGEVVPPGETRDVDVILDAAGLFGGNYHAGIEITTNDPDESEVAVPVDLQVTGAPDIAVLGSEIRLGSTESYTVSSATTDHVLPIAEPPRGSGTFEVIANGDFGAPGEFATVFAEGNPLGQVGNVGLDCQPAANAFTVSPATLAALASDGIVEIQFQNSALVNIGCAVNEHTVTLVYEGPAAPDYGTVFTGYSSVRTITIANAGTEVLNVTSITADLPEYTPAVPSLSVPPQTEATLDITFAPLAPGTYDGTLTVVSDDPDEPVVTVDLTGEGLNPPDIEVTPASLSADLLSGEVEVQTLIVDNLGESDLRWSIESLSADEARVVSSSAELATPPPVPPVKEDLTAPPAPPAAEDIWVEPISPDRPAEVTAGAGPDLEGFLESLNERFQLITDLIPNRYDFSEGVTGISISDGGGDMYDGGNFLETNLGGPIPYSDNTIVDRPDLLGTGGRYFTRKYPGLFVFAADVQGIEQFTISGDLGADGSGQVDGSVLEAVRGRSYLGFVKRVYAAGDPSVNHLIIVEQDPDVTHEFSTNTNDDYHRMTGASNVQRIYYLLYAGTGGVLIGDGDAIEIMNEFLGSSPDWLSATPSSGTVAAGTSQQIDVTFNAAGLFEGDYSAELTITSNDPDDPLVAVPADLHVTGIPDIDLSGERVELSSAEDFLFSGDSTSHAFPIEVPPAGSGSIELIADGDFGSSSERADLIVEGFGIGSVGGVGPDCVPADGEFFLSAGDLAFLAADGVIQATVQNTFSVGTFCSPNRHTVTLRYRQPADRLDYGVVFLGDSVTRSVIVENLGTGTLDATIATDDAQFQPSATSLSIPPEGSHELQVAFLPDVAQVSSATLTITSNDPDEPVVTVTLEGEGRVPPDIEVTPAAIDTTLFTGQSEIHTVTIGNTGGSELIFSIESDLGADEAVIDASPALNTQTGAPPVKIPSNDPPAQPDPAHIHGFPATGATGPQSGASRRPLESILLDLDDGFADVVASIPDRFDFGEGGTGRSILDGGSDAYDGGNFLTTGLGGPLDYTGGAIVADSSFGNGGRYFTRKYPGLFVMVADLEGVDRFTVSGNLGIDGGGFTDGSILQANMMGVSYLGLVKRVYGGTTPSINHLVIVENDLEANHEIGTYTEDDYHSVFLGSQARRLHYLLYQGDSGAYIDDDATLEIMKAYLDAIPFPWFSLNPDAGVVAAGTSQDVTLTMTAIGLESGDYPATVTVESNDPDEPVVTVPVTMHVSGAPDIAIENQSILFESTKEFLARSDSTEHTFEDMPPAAGAGVLELILEGDFDDFSETATVSVEGFDFGPAGNTGLSCSLSSVQFPVPEHQVEQMLADSRLDAEVVNSSDVEPICATNRHTIRFNYPGPSDQIDYGDLFIGLTSVRRIGVVNRGVLDLDVSSISTNQGDFTVSASSMLLAPGTGQSFDLTFAPSAPGPIAGVLTIVSNDPDEGQIDIPLSGIGVIPPDIDVTPDALDETLLVDRQSVQTLDIANTNVGGADLIFDIVVRLSGTQQTNAPMPAPGSSEEFADSRSEQTRDDTPSYEVPENFVSTSVDEVKTAGATVLLIQDALPWDSLANQNVLNNNGIAFDQIASSSLATTDLQPYDLVIVPSDQPDSFYQTIAARKAQIDSWVSLGGTLEFHAAGFGANGGDPRVVTLPDGVGTQRFTDFVNFAVDPNHPIVASVPNRIRGGAASHCYLLDLPPSAHPIVEDTLGRTNLAEYRFGVGRVVVGCQVFEFGLQRGGHVGLMLADMIPWTFSTARQAVWLSAGATSGVVPAETSLPIDMTFDATGLAPDTYTANVEIESNDPDEPVVTIPASLEVARLIADAGPPQVLECDGDNSAMATLDGTGSEHIDGPAGITRYDWLLGEIPLGEGPVLVTTIPLGQNTVTLEIMDATNAMSVDETTITVRDTIAPTGGIVSPLPGVCHGPALLPVDVLDDFVDICDPALDRSYACSSPTGPGGACPDASMTPPYSGHGDYLVSVTATDEGENTRSDSVGFTIDTVPPTVVITEPPVGAQVVLPDDRGFAIVFEAGDDDGAAGDIVHEVIKIDGCVAFDGDTYGTTPNGLLRDETIRLDGVELCRVAEECGYSSLVTPEILVEVTDCGGNVATDVRTIGGSMALIPGSCASIDMRIDGSGSTVASWDAQPGALTYDVVRGDVASITVGGEDVDMGAVQCVEQNSIDTDTVGFEDAEVPAPGQVFFYLVQSNDGSVQSGYGFTSNEETRTVVPQAGDCN